MAKVIRTPERSNIDLFASKKWFNFIMNMQMVALSTINIMMKQVVLFFYPLLTLIFGMSTFCSNYSSTSLWHSVNIFPKNFKTNVIPCLLQLKPKAFLWMYNRSVQFIFQLAQICSMELRTSPSFLMFQQIPSVAGSSGNSSFYGYCNGQFNKNNWNLLNMPSVLIILATTV